jgi:dihydrofolate reductase
MEALVRAERPTDRGAIDVVHLASFPTSAEANQVARLRAAGRLSVSLVAEAEKAIVGHLAYGDGRGVLGVLPAYRDRGIDTALIQAGTKACRAADLTGAPLFVEPPTGYERRRREPLAMILALGPRGELGQAGRVPWDVREDRAFFATTTRGHAVIMGRRTWEEQRRPLPGRINFVVSTSIDELDGAERFTTLSAAIDAARARGAMPFVIGGARLYEEGLDDATRVYLTEIQEPAPEADVFFHLDQSRLEEIASWAGASGERYRVLSKLDPPAR